MNGHPVAYSRSVITELMVPSYANFGGKVHGGTLMSLMDKLAYVCARVLVRPPEGTIVRGLRALRHGHSECSPHVASAAGWLLLWCCCWLRRAAETGSERYSCGTVHVVCVN